jgi:hypothetical protein
MSGSVAAIQANDFMALIQGTLDEMRPDEARGASHENPHTSADIVRNAFAQLIRNACKCTSIWIRSDIGAIFLNDAAVALNAHGYMPVAICAQAYYILRWA